MSAQSPSIVSASTRSRLHQWWLPLIILFSGLGAYAGSFSGPFIFDDVDSIVTNETIRHWSTALWPPISSTVGGRPILNLSLAVNYAISGTAVWSYHVLNLLIHLLSGLALFGVVRRTLAEKNTKFSEQAAFCVAVLWVVHPLNTEAVTYVVQRAESLMGLFYLLTLYGFIRGAQSESRRGAGWYVFSVATCLCGMATKEVMVSAPVVLLLYDRTFLAGTFRHAFNVRWKVHAGLMATWLVLPILVISAQGREGSAGFSTDVSWWRYALSQFPAIIHYLKLSFWPHPLIFDYGTAITADLRQILPTALLVLSLAAVTIWAVFKRPTVGFLGVTFFAILAPTSSVVPIVTEPMAEHRMYLALIPVIGLIVVGAYRLWDGKATLILSTLAAVTGWLTFQRNETYRSEASLWRDTVANHPTGARAHHNVAVLLAASNQTEAAIGEYEEALRLKPNYVQAYVNLGKSLHSAGRTGEAIARYEEALRLNPNFGDAHYNLAVALAQSPGRLNEAITHYETALRINPVDAQAQESLGKALYASGNVPAAIAHLETALKLNPDSVDAHYNLAISLSQIPGRQNEAIAEYQTAVALKPDSLEAHNNLGNLLSAAGRLPEAISEFEIILHSKPDIAPIHCNLALALLRANRIPEAVEHLKTALQLEPENQMAHQLLDSVPKSQR